MSTSHPPEPVRPRLAARVFYRHNANVTLMRTTPEECAAIGSEMAAKLSGARGPVSVLLPSRGVSAIDLEGRPFDNPVARRALHDAIRQGLPHPPRGHVPAPDAGVET